VKYGRGVVAAFECREFEVTVVARARQVRAREAAAGAVRALAYARNATGADSLK